MKYSEIKMLADETGSVIRGIVDPLRNRITELEAQQEALQQRLAALEAQHAELKAMPAVKGQKR